MFFTCVARRRNSRPRASASASQLRGVRDTQVALRLPHEAFSTMAPAPPEAKYQRAATSSCSASTLASGSLSPVTILTTPAGTSLVSSS